MENYRRGVGIFLLNQHNQLWVGKRIDFSNDYWQMPQGGIDDGESPKEAMIRELAEEVGIKKNYDIVSETKDWFYYTLPKNVVNKIWSGQFIGQKQKWFACKFFGTDKEIVLDNHEPEFDDWKWIKPCDSLKYVIPFKRDLYKNVLESFKEFYV